MSSDPLVSVGPEHISDRVIRVPLPLPLADLRAVNAFIVRGDDGLTLIDPGWASEETETALLAALRGLGCGPTDVRRILVTHSHWDHYTQALVWGHRYGIPVLLHREERHSIEAWHDLDGAFPLQVELLRRAGADGLAEEIRAWPVQAEERDMAFGEPDEWLVGGEEIDCGGVVLRALATPGHTRGHVVFEDAAAGLLFTGDHVLPRITPSIAYERAPSPVSLHNYLGSLHLLLDRPDARLLPAHGAPQASTRERARELVEHHEQRLNVVAALVQQGERTAYDIAVGMVWTRHERSLTDLGTVHAMTAVLEVAAHLEVLTSRGRVQKQPGGHRDEFTVPQS